MPASSTRHWLIKSEPFKYAFEQLVRDGKTVWDGIRNFEARNNLREMKKGDLCLFYHSNEGKAVVGIAEVSREAFHDPTTEEDFSAVEVVPVRALAREVGLDEMRTDALLAKMMIFRRQRLSVVPVTKTEFDEILARSQRPPPADVPAARTRGSTREKRTAAQNATSKRTTAKKRQPPKRTRAHRTSRRSKRER
jgi:predicted RNA-binding protein with PUA-like domain